MSKIKYLIEQVIMNMFKHFYYYKLCNYGIMIEPEQTEYHSVVVNLRIPIEWINSGVHRSILFIIVGLLQVKLNKLRMVSTNRACLWSSFTIILFIYILTLNKLSVDAKKSDLLLERSEHVFDSKQQEEDELISESGVAKRGLRALCNEHLLMTIN